LNISFSNVKYLDTAPLVGLDPLWNLGDAPLIDLHPSQIPTALFRDIVTDMDILLIQYGTLQDHTMEEVGSCFLAPVSILPTNAWITDFFKYPSDLQLLGGTVW
jgi:hypothetical protein